MTKKDIEAIIGKIVVDKEYRNKFLANPEEEVKV